jgi:hypothetical protein
MMRGLEGLNARMDDAESTADETTIDVDIQVADRTEEASSIVEEAASVVADADAADSAADDIEALEHMYTVLKDHGLQPGVLAIINRGDALARFSGRPIPAVESLDATGRNHNEAQMAMEAISDSIRKGWEAVKKFFKSLWEKIVALAAKVRNMFTSFASAIKRAKESLSEVNSIDDKKASDKKFSLLKKGQFVSFAGAVSAGIDAVKSADAGKAEGTDGYVASLLGSDKIEPLGLKRDGDSITTVEKPLATDSMTLKDSEWDLAFAKGDGFKTAQLIVGGLAEYPSSVKSFKNLCDMGIKRASALEKSGEAKNDDDKKAIDRLRKAGSELSKVATKVASRGSLVPRAYISACAALRACKA